ncbi:MAG: bifunctional serine/threonine-protein kinase/formylglycine-generating enzyme family protein [Hyphomonadaceae bacterium]|nr:bifunctional serine/threonine-protein kinase/formylglycine-generating enzyme family protein [Hyphomonadaceae bacterium]
MSEPAATHALALPPGTRLGELEIERVLGQGGFAVTYLARRADGEARVIKECVPAGLVVRRGEDVLPVSPDAASAFQHALTDFEQEARQLAKLAEQSPHPALPQVSAPRRAFGSAWFEMPYLGAETLADRIAATGPMPRAQLEPIAARLLEALSVLEAQRLHHRDIKPANIVLSDTDGMPVLIDFGAAKSIIDAATQMHTRVGTEHYRAPEQLAGHGEIGARTDIYGLAATLYHAVTGEAPPDASARQFAQINGAADPIRDLAADEGLRREHGPAFLNAVMAGLKLRMGERPARVTDWRALFLGQVPKAAAMSARAGVETSPVPARPSSAQRPRHDTYLPEPERTPWGRYLTAGLLLALIVGAGGWLAMTSLSGGAGEKPVVADGPSEPDAPPTRSADDEAWVRALEADTLAGYRAYLDAFPNGRYAEAAQAEVDRYDHAAWAEAEQRNTLAGYEDYLEAFPEGRHAGQAQERADAIRRAEEAAAADAAERAAREAADWDRAASADTVASYTEYLTTHPSGAHARDARARREALQAIAADRAAFQQAESMNTVEGYERYIASFPQGAFVMRAAAAIEALRPTPGREFRDCPDCPTMVSLPAGTANLGAPASDSEASPAEGPQRPVTFGGLFAMSVTEVTFNDWQICVDAGACSAVASDNGWGRGRRPVINVSWNDAQAYTAWLSQKTGHAYSLPSEAQWEYAARGGETGTHAGGSPTAMCAFANGAGSESGLPWANSACGDPAPDRTLPAGSLLENGFGLRDMIGNVAEWTLDCNTLNLRDAPGDGSADLRGSCGQRAVRGGSWFSGPKDLRYTARLMQRRGDSNDFTGFRVVREIES